MLGKEEVLINLGERQGEAKGSSFNFQIHVDRGLSSLESAEILAEHFSEISQELPPLRFESLPQNVRQFLLQRDPPGFFRTESKAQRIP